MMQAEFEAFVAPARRRPSLWRLALGCVLIVLIIFGWFAAELVGVWLLGGGDLVGRVLSDLLTPDTPQDTLLLLSSFIGMALAPMVAAWLLHRRGPGSLFGPRARVVRDFGRAFAVVAVIYLVSIPLLMRDTALEANLPPHLWAMLLPLSLGLVLIQTGAEELIFRGYLMQQIAARIPWRIAYMILPSALFGVLHYDVMSAGGNAWLLALAAGVFGLIAADLTYATGSLGAAWGLHFANNVAALLIIATQGTITGLALYVTPYAADEVEVTRALIVLDIGTLVLIWAVLRWWLRR